MKPKELRAWRLKHKYSQIRLAEILGVATQTVYRWENKKREIPSFLHLTLGCLEKKGGDKKPKGKKIEEKGGKKVNGNSL